MLHCSQVVLLLKCTCVHSLASPVQQSCWSKQTVALSTCQAVSMLHDGTCMGPSINNLTGRLIIQTTNQLISQPIKQSVKSTVSQSIDQSHNRQVSHDCDILNAMQGSSMSATHVLLSQFPGPLMPNTPKDKVSLVVSSLCCLPL